MISVCAMAIKPVTVVCFRTVDSAPMPKNRGATIEKATIEIKSTKAGISVGFLRR